MLTLDRRYDAVDMSLAAARARLVEPVRREPMGRVVLAAGAAALSALALAAAVVFGPPGAPVRAGPSHPVSENPGADQQPLSSQR